MIEFAFVIVVSVTAYTWTALLTQPGDIFERLPSLVANHPLLLKVLFQCERCFAGQLSLWLYPALFWNTYAWQVHFVVVIFSIFLANTIARLYEH